MFYLQQTPESYITLKDLLTNPASAVLAVTVVTAGLAYVANRNPRWLGLVVTLFVVFGSTLLNGKPSLETLFLAVLNSFVIFFSAAGLSAAVASGLQTGQVKPVIQGSGAPQPAQDKPTPVQAEAATTYAPPEFVYPGPEWTSPRRPFFQSWW
jgi:hypothetical protein